MQAHSSLNGYLLTNPACKPQTHVPALQFGDLGGAVARLIGIIDANRTVELASTDFLGMCLPRSAIEYSERGPDAGRENIVREVWAMCCNVFVAGLFSHLFMRLMGNRVNAYNPHGIPARAWVGAESLNAFGHLYEGILKEHPALSPLEARQMMVRQVLSNMVAENHHSAQAALASLNSLPELQDDEAALKIIEQRLKDTLPPEKMAELTQSLADKSGTERAVLLKSALTNVKEGRLDAKSLDELCRYFDFKPENAQDAIAGASDFNRRAAARVATLKANLLEEARRANRSAEQALQGFDEVLEFAKARLSLSLDDLRETNGQFIAGVRDRAVAGGLSDSVQLLGADGKPIIQKLGLQTGLKDLKHFLEQYVDRAHHGLEHREGWQNDAAHRLFARSKKPGWWRRFIPQADDGLMAAALKSKLAYSWIPVSLAAIIGISSAFYISWQTQKRHGGKLFFPGDGVPPPHGHAQKQQAPAPSGHAAPMSLYNGPPLQRSKNGAFAVFQRGNNAYASNAFPAAQNGTVWNTPANSPFTGGLQAAGYGGALRFGAMPNEMAGMAANKIGAMSRAFDFKDLASCTVPQIMVIYGLTILARIANAMRRSWNEVRETSIRDSLGYSFWLLTVPVVQRLFLKYLAPKKYRDSLIQVRPPVPPQPGEGIWGKLRNVNRKYNPLMRWAIPTSQDIKDQMRHTLETVERAGFAKDGKVYRAAEKHFKEGLLRWRNYATGLGWGLTIGSFIAVMYMNIWITRQRVAEGKVGKY